MKLQTGSDATLTDSLSFDTMAEGLLHKIAHLLVAKAKIATDVQLSMGKTGFSLFLFHYYSFTQNEAHYNNAHELLDKIYETVTDPAIPVHKSVQIQLGWLFMYLQNHDFIEINTDEVLHETDTLLFNACANGSFTNLHDGYVTDTCAYLVLRYGSTVHRPQKMKIEEALINLVDEIRLRYPREIKDKFIDMDDHSHNYVGIAYNKLIRSTCNVCILLAKIIGPGIYRQIITNMIADLYESVLAPVLTKQQCNKGLLNSYPGYGTLSYILYTKTIITPYIKNVITSNYGELINPDKNPVIYSKESTPYIGDLLLTIACLHSLNGKTLSTTEAGHLQALTTKLYASVNKNAPGHVDSLIGIPDLGLKDGMAGVGMALLQILKNESLVNDDILLLTIK